LILTLFILPLLKISKNNKKGKIYHGYS
jgi:hypothetical protein